MPVASDPAAVPPDPSPAALAEARTSLGQADPAALRGFAARQRAALARLGALEAFYASHKCRMARLHGLASAVVVLHRFQGASAVFERIGALIHPLTDDGAPRGPRWEAYARACRLGRAIEVRDELWIAAHAADLAAVRSEGLEAAFEAEAARHPGHPAWRGMRRHLAFTLGSQRLDDPALAGEIALETAMADAMGRSVRRMLRDGGATFLRTVVLGARALVAGGALAAGLPSYRRAAWLVLRGALASIVLVQVWAKGMREARRGDASATFEWPLLAQTLGDRVAEVHPLVVAFYTNPAHYDLECALELHTAPALFWSWLLTLVAGQGLYEAAPRPHAARIRTYRRADGSMHFVREIDTGRALRVFDSDFLVRDHRGAPTLFERFPGISLEYELVVTPLGPGQGVSIRGRDLYWRGLRLPSTGLEVEFRSAVETTPDGEVLRLDGDLALRPRTALGRFLAYRVLRRPERLARIRYTAVPRAPAAGDPAWPFLA